MNKKNILQSLEFYSKCTVATMRRSVLRPAEVWGRKISTYRRSQNVEIKKYYLISRLFKKIVQETMFQWHPLVDTSLSTL